VGYAHREAVIVVVENWLRDAVLWRTKPNWFSRVDSAKDVVRFVRVVDEHSVCG